VESEPAAFVEEEIWKRVVIDEEAAFSIVRREEGEVVPTPRLPATVREPEVMDEVAEERKPAAKVVDAPVMRP